MAVVLALVGLLVGALVLVTDAGASASTHLVTVERAALSPVGAKALGAQVLGAQSASVTQTGAVALKPRNPAALKTFIANVTSTHSASYHDYLRPGQFEARFGPAPSTIAAVKSVLAADGLSVTGVSSNGLLVHFRGSTSQVESAFHTSLERYRTAAGVTGEQTTSAIELPSSISADVAAVTGLDTLVQPDSQFKSVMTQRGRGVAATGASAGASRAAGHGARRGAHLLASTGHSAARGAHITSYPSGSPDPTCAGAGDAATALGGLTDDQVANAYGAFGLYGAGDTGQGVHIGVFEAEPYSRSDIQTFDQCYFGAGAATQMLSRLSTIPVDGGQSAGSGSGESLLDIEDISAIAPGADIDVYETPAFFGDVLDEYAQMVDDDTDSIISSSWGLCEQAMNAYEPGVMQAESYVFEQAAAQGQTVLDAAGDDGSDGCMDVGTGDPVSTDDPASQPYVLAVGGTTIHNADPAAYDESVWNDGLTGGGTGGGLSSNWAAPGWQQLVTGFPTPGSADYTNAATVEQTALSTGISTQNWPAGFCQITLGVSTPCRALPDVSADADEYTGAVTVYSASFASSQYAFDGGWSTIGGTSSATPIWAALLALVDSSATCAGNGLTNGIGFASPLLYEVAENPSEYASAFHDITVGDNDVDGYDNGLVYPATTAYDLASGLGSPQLTDTNPSTPGLAADLCGLAATGSARPVVSSLTPAVGDVNGGDTVTIAGSGFTPGGGVSVASVTIGAATLTAADLTVTSTSISFSAPSAHAALSAGATGTQDGSGPAIVTVTMTNGATSQLSAADIYEYVDESAPDTSEPSVDAVSPFAGIEDSSTAPKQVTIYGDGFSPTGDTVSFGGQDAAAYTYISAHEIKVTPPAYSGAGTDCSTAAALAGEYPDEYATAADAATQDVCQTNVAVTDAAGDTSAQNTIKPAYEGAVPGLDDDGALELPAGTEVEPQPDEYDYVPAPTITSVSTDDAADDADAYGGTVVELDGSGLNNMTLNWINFGDPTQASSQDDSIVAYGGTYVDIEVPMTAEIASQLDAGSFDPVAGPEPTTVPVSADTLVGLSPSSTDLSGNTTPAVTYAGVPVIDSVSLSGAGTGSDTFEGETDPAGPASGGSALTITGQGMSDVLGPIGFETQTSIGAQFSFSTPSDQELDTQTVQQNAGLAVAMVCSVSGCSQQLSESSDGSFTESTNADFLLYPPGNPKITSVSLQPDGVADTLASAPTGPADGGTWVTITGENLGCVTGVSFGSVPALGFVNDSGPSGCGSTTSVEALAPAGTAGTTAAITLTTIESDVQSTPLTATSPTPFHYVANPSISAASYGAVSIGAASTKTVTITNTTGSDLTLGGFDEGDQADDPATIIGDNPSEFTITGDGCSGMLLTAGEACTITVAFAPTASGSQDAILDLPFNDSPTDLQTPLSGSGTVPTSTVTTTVTTPAVTVTSPGTSTVYVTPAQTVTSAAPATQTVKTITCELTPHVAYERVKVKVKVKLHGRTRIETKWELKKVHFSTKSCHTQTSSK